MSRLFGWRAAVSGALGLCVLSACAGQRTVSGACESVYDGNVCTWGILEGDQVTAFGATLSLATVENVPLDGPMEFPPVPKAIIPLPDDVVRNTGFNYLNVYWEPHGHPPALFFTPHFDFHFVTISPDQSEAIDCSDTRKPKRIPAEYAIPDIDIPDMGTMVGLCVPQMGMHAMPAAELEETAPFEATMIIGYYGEELIFLEPMISRAKLLEGKSFSLPVPAVPDKNASLRWPTRSEVVFDAKRKEYRFVFSNLSG